MNEELYLEPIKYSCDLFTDDRGSFSPFVIGKEFSNFNIFQLNTVETNYPYTFRGMHWQDPPYAQAKIIRCLFGKIIDFVIDIRVGSPNYGKVNAFYLSSPEEWLYVPVGFAHGYVTLPHNLSQTYPTIVEYLVNNHYNKESERGVCLPQSIIDILMSEIPSTTDLIINDRDISWPTIEEINSNFKYEPDDQRAS